LFNSSFAFFSCQAEITLLIYKTAVGENLTAFWLDKSNIEGSLLLGSGASFSMPK
jgi:hypothetical protein